MKKLINIKALLLIIPVLLVALVGCNLAIERGRLDCVPTQWRVINSSTAEIHAICNFRTITPTRTPTVTPTPTPERAQYNYYYQPSVPTPTPVPATELGDRRQYTPVCEDIPYGHTHIPPSYGRFSGGSATYDGHGHSASVPNIARGVQHKHWRKGDACDTYKISTSTSRN